MSCGIYKITNNINKKCYIGQSVDIERRWRQHKYNASQEVKYPLYLAFKKYGLNNFYFEIIQECSLDQLDQQEIYWIQFYDSYKNGYNQTTGGQGNSNNIIKLSIEDVNIIYDLLKNTLMPQKDIASMFDVGDDTISEINQGKTRIRSDFVYPLRKNKNDPSFCYICGKPVLHGSTYCVKCLGLKNRVVTRPNRKELKHLIRTMPFTQIGIKYGVTDNTIRKWCDSEGLPRKVSDIKKYSDQEWENL